MLRQNGLVAPLGTPASTRTMLTWTWAINVTYAAPEWIGRASGHPCKHQDNVDLDLGHKRYSMVHELSCGLSVIQDCWDSSDVDQILGLFRRWMMERNVNCKETLEMKHGRKLRNAHAASPHHRENRDGPMPGHTPLHGRRGGTS
eukprot:CAMPEP_0172787854 /NCGR_PEP_ID=MMETSP1074-20121228/206660_1 /TAXON_ID=2916 /ORGANISM="Ceratium fusus, Strain PA161109" /LENGTH=144 /DNA_ID=CAMNT_0013624875 /DNA_START=739 /DNA_END=1170 /DNA_ORIENTATION=+